MKTLFLIISIALLSFESYSQISLDFQSMEYSLEPVKLSNNETKYYNSDQWRLNHNRSFEIYNLDGTLYKTIQMPQKPDTSAFSFDIQYLSTTLFDNDPSNIEYLIEYEWDSIYGTGYSQHEIKVIREDGTILFDEMYGRFAYIYPTEEGTKLRLSGYYYANGTLGPYRTRVFNLPGDLTTDSENQFKPISSSTLVYPNPNNGSFYIKFQLNEEKVNSFSLFSLTGKLIQTFKANDQVTHFDNQTLLNGLYFLNTNSNTKTSTTKVIIKK